MRRICFVLLILIFSMLRLNGQNESALINWNAKKLVWSDFQGIPEKTKQEAVTSSGLYFNYSIINDTALSIIVVAQFDKKLSWVKPSSKMDEVLRHEQLHFDISEVLQDYFEIFSWFSLVTRE